MNRTELADSIAKSADITVMQADETIKTILDGITQSLAQGIEVSFIGFGRFKVNKRAARTVMNPKTKEKIAVKASKVPSFRAGKGLKESVNGG